MIKKEKKEKVKKIKKEKNILPGVIITGLLTATIVYAVMLNAEKNMLADFEKGTVYVSAKQIPEGQLITDTNWQEYLKSLQADVKLIPENAITSQEELYQLISINEIDTGVFLTKGMFESVNEVTANMKEPVIASCKADDLYQVVGGVLRAGDRIHIYVVSEAAEAKLLWENVFIQQVFDQAGNFISNEDTTTSAQRMNLYMDKQDVETFYRELALGSLRIVKACE